MPDQGRRNLDAIQVRTFEHATEATRVAYPPERRLDLAAMAAYLDRRSYLVVASTRPDGRPHAAMSAFVRRGSTFWLPTVTGSVRERNVRQTPALSLVVTEGDDDAHVVVLLEGRASVVEPSAVPADVADAMPGAWVSRWLRVDVDRVLSYAAPGAQPEGDAARG